TVSHERPPRESWDMKPVNLTRRTFPLQPVKTYGYLLREQWASIAERAPDDATADYLHQVFEPTAQAIDGLEKALAGLGLLDDALALDLRRPQDYFQRLWSIGFRANELANIATGDPDGEQEQPACPPISPAPAPWRRSRLAATTPSTSCSASARRSPCCADRKRPSLSPRWPAGPTCPAPFSTTTPTPAPSSPTPSP